MRAFGFEVFSINGNDFAQLETAFNTAKTVEGKPSVFWQHHQGKGVCFMENEADWHGKAPNDEERQKAQDELSAMLAQLGGGHNGQKQNALPPATAMASPCRAGRPA